MSESFVRLRAGGRTLALPALAVRAIAPHRPCMRVPLAPLCVLGLDLHEGRLMTVLDLALCIDHAAARGPDSALRLLLASPFAHLALVVADRPSIGDDDGCEGLDLTLLLQTIEAGAAYPPVSA